MRNSHNADSRHVEEQSDEINLRSLTRFQRFETTSETKGRVLPNAPHIYLHETVKPETMTNSGGNHCYAK